MLYKIATVIEAASKNRTDDVPLTAHEAFSGVLGSVSLACWLFLLLPQLVENYRNQSAEAISLAFVIVWFLGDLANLLGALLANLVPTVILIAIYFCISDGLLIGQVLYYGIRNKRREGRGLLASVKDTVVQADSGIDRFPDGPHSVRGSVDSTNELERQSSAQEIEPLLSRKHSRGNSYSTYTIPGSADPKAVREQIARRRSSSGSQNAAAATRLRRKSSSTAAASAQQEPLAKIFEEPDVSAPKHRSMAARVAKNASFIFAVILVGSVGWLIAFQTGTWKPVPPPTPDTDNPSDLPDDADNNAAGAQFLGYASAILYLTARLPQIWKNYREKSCEGLSILFFILSLLGNATYGAGILAHSLQKDYVLTNVPWLLGSLGTMFEDAVVFYQFKIYQDSAEDTAIDDDDAAASAAAAISQADHDVAVATGDRS